MTRLRRVPTPPQPARRLGIACAAATALIPFGLAHAQSQSASESISATGESSAGEKEWKISITPYAWIPAQEGRMTVAGHSADVDLSVSDTFDTIADNFNLALCLHAELARERFTIFGDAMYVRLESQDAPTEAGLVDVQYVQGIFELGAAYSVIDRPVGEGEMHWKLEPLAGMRVHYFSGEVNIPGPDNDADRDEAWIDGFVGLRTRFSFNDTISLVARGDAGAGGSDFTWSALAAAEFNFTSWASLTLGYRALDDDYATGDGADRFAYHVLLHGPFLAFTFTF